MKARETPHRRVPARELARHTARLLDEVLAGETIEVTRAGRPVAVLTPIDPVDRDLGAAVDAGILDPAVLQDEHGAELEEILARLAATRQTDPESSATRALLAMRDEEDR
jgi:prevent-host-death family protein